MSSPHPYITTHLSHITSHHASHTTNCMELTTSFLPYHKKKLYLLNILIPPLQFELFFEFLFMVSLIFPLLLSIYCLLSVIWSSLCSDPINTLSFNNFSKYMFLSWILSTLSHILLFSHLFFLVSLFILCFSEYILFFAFLTCLASHILYFLSIFIQWFTVQIGKCY